MKGTYTIIVDCKSAGYCTFGSLGRTQLLKGRYLYTGSALGSGATPLERRLKRHRKHSKAKRWHIDYLTSNRGCKVISEIFVASSKRLECAANQSISRDLNLMPLLPKIGSSDCKCKGHLLGPQLHSSKENLVKHVVAAYVHIGLRRSSIIVRDLD